MIPPSFPSHVDHQFHLSGGRMTGVILDVRDFGSIVTAVVVPAEGRAAHVHFDRRMFGHLVEGRGGIENVLGQEVTVSFTGDEQYVRFTDRAEVARGLLVPLGVDTNWPRLGDAGMDERVFQAALDERSTEAALTAAGYERVYETGVEGTGYGVASETALDECLTQMAMYGNALFVLTVVVCQCRADITLWRKGAAE